MSTTSEVLLYVVTQDKDNFNIILNTILETLSTKYETLLWKIDDIMQTIVTKKEDYPCLKYDEYLFLIHDFIKWEIRDEHFYSDLLSELLGKNIEFVSNFVRVGEELNDFDFNQSYQNFSEENLNEKTCRESFFRYGIGENIILKIETTDNNILNKHMLE